MALTVGGLSAHSGVEVEALDAIQTLLARPSTYIEATLSSGATSPATVVVQARGWYDRTTGRATFRQTVWLDPPTGRVPVYVDSIHQDGLIYLRGASATPGCPSGSWLTVQALELAEGHASAQEELARLGRYQPQVAIDLLAGIDPASLVASEDAGVISVDVSIDQGAAVAATRADLHDQVKANLDAFAVRRFTVHLTIDDASRVREIILSLGLPTGSGSVAHQATWSISLPKVPERAGWTAPTRGLALCDLPPLMADLCANARHLGSGLPSMSPVRADVNC